MDNTYFRDQILSRGFKGIVYQREKQCIEPVLSLTASEMTLMTNDAISKYGFSDYTEVANFINRITREFKTAPGLPTPNTTISSIGNGDSLIITDTEGAQLRMIKLGLNRFLVTADTANILLPGDELYFMQFALSVGKQLYAQAYRNAQLLAPQGYVFFIEEIGSLEIARGNYFQYQNFFKSGASASVKETTSPSIVYTNDFDAVFNGFTDASLKTTNQGELIEINLSKMTYRLNPGFDRDAHFNDSEIFGVIANAFDIVEHGYNIYRLQPVSDGAITLSEQSGVHYLSVTRKAQCTLQ